MAPSANSGISPSPRSFQIVSVISAGSERRGEGESLTPASAEKVRDGGRDEEECVGRLEPDGPTCDQAGEHTLGEPWRLERAQHERSGDDHRHHRRVVGELGEPECLWEELVHPPLVVAADEERNRHEWRGDPEHTTPDSEDAAADPLADVEDCEQRDRPEDEHVECDRGRKGADELRAAGEGEGRQDEWPPVADDRGRDDAVP